MRKPILSKYGNSVKLQRFLKKKRMGTSSQSGRSISASGIQEYFNSMLTTMLRSSRKSPPSASSARCGVRVGRPPRAR